MNTQEIQSKIQRLRERWVSEPEKRKTILMQYEVLKMALEVSNDPFAKEVLASLG